MSPSPIYIGANATGWLSFYDPARTEQKARGSYRRPYPLTQPDQLRPGRCLSWVNLDRIGPFGPCPVSSPLATELRTSLVVRFVPTHKVAALQPAARVAQP